MKYQTEPYQIIAIFIDKIKLIGSKLIYTENLMENVENITLDLVSSCQKMKH